ncbi:phosphotransferase [Candidatus Woesearchaeota archaeon]|nr:phosphotransferase [Candidatus Woesearchaeota archaeon]
MSQNPPDLESIIGNVTQVIQDHTLSKRRTRPDYNSLKTVEDWIEEKEKHPEWAGLSAWQVIKLGGNVFYKEFQKWNKSNTSDTSQREVNYNSIFSRQRERYENLRTVDEWIEFRNKNHPEWKGRTRNEMEESPDSNSFWTNYRKWTRRTARTKEEKEQFLQVMALRTRNDYSSLTTITDWKKLYNENPHWHKMSTPELLNDKQGGGASFYSSFNFWISSQTSDEKERKRIRRRVISYNLRDWSGFESIGDWINTYLRTNSWHDMDSTHLGTDEKGEGKYFYHNFKKFLQKEYTTQRKRTQARAVLDINLPPYQWDAVQAIREERTLEDIIGVDRTETREAVTAMNALKLVQNQWGDYLDRDKYAGLIREIFNDSMSLEHHVGSDSKRVEAYLQAADLEKVSITEQIVDPSSKNPNVRISLYLGTDPQSGSDQTIEAFVKFFSDKQERDTELTLTNWFAQYSQVKTVGQARATKVTARIEKNNDQTETYDTLTICAIEDKTGENASYVLVTPFANLRTTAQELQGRAGQRVLDMITNAVYEFHQTPAPSHNTEEVVSTRMRFVPYSESARQEIANENTSLYQQMQRMGIMKKLDRYATQHQALIHGDCHTKNLLLNEDNEIVFADLERTRRGIPQQDITKYLGARSHKLSTQEQQRQLDRYIALSGITDQQQGAEFKRIYDVVTVYEELRVCRHIVDRPSTFQTIEAWQESFEYHLDRALDHARKAYSATQVEALEKAARKTLVAPHAIQNAV